MKPRVLLLHNCYRATGGEEQSVHNTAELLRSRGHVVELLERSSADLEGIGGKLQAGKSLLAGGSQTQVVVQTVESFKPDVVHVHNMLPLFGPRALKAAHRRSVRVVMHLHNYRLFCSIAIGYRDHAPCSRCSGRNTLSAVRLNCRGSRVESALYASALALHQPTVLRSVDRFLTPSSAAAERLTSLGLPSDRTAVVPHFVAGGRFAKQSQAATGQYALFVGRLVEEKGADHAIRTAAAAGVPLKIVGSGPETVALRQLAQNLGGDVELLGQLDLAQLQSVRDRAALALVPSRCEESFGLTALEAAASGLPTLVSDIGGLPEVVGREAALDPHSLEAWTAAARALWGNPELRSQRGEAALTRVHELFNPDRFYDLLMQSYGVQP